MRSLERLAAIASGQKSLKPATPQMTRRSPGTHGESAAAWPAGRIAARRVPPMDVGTSWSGVSRSPTYSTPPAARCGRIHSSAAATSSPRNAYGWPIWAASRRRPSRGVDAAGIPATSIPPGPQWVAAWPLARTWTRAPDSAAAMAAVSPARPAPMTTTSALGTDHLPGRFGRLVLDQRFDPQPTFVDAGDHPLLLQLAAGRDGSRSLEALPEEPEDRSIRQLGDVRRTGMPRPFPHDAGGPERAEATLARPHPEACAAPDVIERAARMPVEEVVQHGPGHELALAQEVGIPAALRLVVGQPMAQPVRLPGDLVRQDLVRGGARLGDAQLGAHHVDGVLGHPAERGELAADDRDEVLHAVHGTVVEDRVRTRDLAAVLHCGSGRLGGWMGERPNAREGGQETQLAKVGEELLALANQRCHLVAGDLVPSRVLNALLGRAEDGDRVDGDHDVAVGGLVAAVDHRVGHALVEDEHRALAGVHRDRHAPSPLGGCRTRGRCRGRARRQCWIR